MSQTKLQQELMAAIIAESQDKRGKHVIPSLEIRGKALEFWCLPLSAADMGRYGKALLDGKADAFVDLLIDKAESEGGDRLFSDDSAKWLKPRIDRAALGEISLAMGAHKTTNANLGEAGGNSEGTQSKEPS